MHLFVIFALQSLMRWVGFSLPALEWQSLPERGFLLDHTLPHRLPLQTAKGKQDIAANKEAAYIHIVTVKHTQCLLPAKTCFTLFSFLLFFSPAFPPPPYIYSLSLCLFPGCIYHENLPPKYQQQRQHLSWHSAITVVSGSHHLQR